MNDHREPYRENKINPKIEPCCTLYVTQAKQKILTNRNKKHDLTDIKIIPGLYNTNLLWWTFKS